MSMAREALVVAAALALAGCLGPAEDVLAGVANDATTVGALGVHAVDEAGDATQRSYSMMMACRAVGCGASPAPDSRAPIVAPDLTAVRLVAERDGVLVVETELAVLSEDFRELVRDDGNHQVAEISTCLGLADSVGCLVTDMSHTSAGPSTESRWQHQSECNEWSVCLQSVPMTVVAGEPAVLRYELPAAYLGDAPVVTSVEATAALRVFEPTLPAPHVAFTVFVPGDHKHEHMGPFFFQETVDELASVPVDVALTPAIARTVEDGVIVRSGPGVNWGGKSAVDDPRYDLREVRVAEDSEGMTLRFVLGAWDPEPVESMHHVMEFGTEGSTVYEAGVLREGGETYGYVGHCITYDCDGPFVSTSRAHNHGGYQYKLPFESHEDGFSVHVPWEHVPDIQAGERLNLALTMIMYADLGVYVGEYGDDVHGDVHKMSMLDVTWGGFPYEFTIGAGEMATGHEH